MITINFQKERSRRSTLGDDSRIIPIISAVFSGVIILLVHLYYRGDESKLFDQFEQLTTEVAALRRETGEVAKLDTLKEELRSQIAMVGRLKRKKKGPVHILDDINLSLPERAWLTEISEKGGNLKIIGKALDNQTISEFMKRLTESTYIEKIDLNETRQEFMGDVGVQVFSLNGKISYSLKDREKRSGNL